MNWKEFDHPSGTDLATGLLLTVAIFAAVSALIVVVYALITVSNWAAQEEAKRTGEPPVNPLFKKWKIWFDGLTDAVPLEQQSSIMLHHDYDGIQELDNHLPPWWKGLFYATVVFAGVYIFIYHFSDIAPLQLAEYKAENIQAAKDIAEYNAHMAAGIDETNVKLVSKPSDLEAGKAVYVTNCKACHGAFGEGGVGPNFADNYWLHGNTIQDIFKTIKYGVSGKGMVSWQGKLKPQEMQQVASYILAFQGTSPPNPKAPQGKEYAAKGAAPSAATPADSAAKADTGAAKQAAKPAAQAAM